MMNLSRNPTSRRRGSALILVVAMLAVLAIFSLTLGFNTRMELSASRNWGNAVQARMAAQTGVALFQNGNTAPNTPFFARSAGQGESRLRPVFLRLEANAIEPALAADEAALPTRSARGPANAHGADDAAATQPPLAGQAALAKTIVQDTSAKIDINALIPARERPRIQPLSAQSEISNRAPSPVFLSEDLLARFIQNVLAARGIGDVDAPALAHAIALRRYGADRRPGAAGVDDNFNGVAADALSTSLDARRARALNGLPPRIDRDGLDNNLNGHADEGAEAIDDPIEAAADPRLAPAGDDRPFISVGELLSIHGMTPAAYEALAPYLTVFSASHAAFDLAGTPAAAENEGFPQVDPNNATPGQIFDVLRSRFPNAPDQLLAQFTVNIIDRRDPDGVPTEWEYKGASYYGLELTPFINEVCSDVASLDDEGDDGQYVELINPYDKPINIAGWSLSGAGPAFRLSGSIPGGGLLVLTNDFNDQNDTSPEINQPSLGSFYKLFNRVSNGGSRHLIEVRTLQIPNESGRIELRDAEGQVVDVFEYSGGTWMGSPKSFQRDDPRVRAATLRRATPLESNAGSDTDTRRMAFALQVQQQWQDQPFADALDVMLVSSAYGAGVDPATAGSSHAFALPELAGGSSQLDLRLVDCFRIGAVVPDRSVSAVPAAAAARANLQRLREAGNRRNAAGLQSAAVPFTPPRANADVVFGRININTAAPVVLASLPGMTPTLLNRIVGARTSHATASVLEVQLTSADPAYWREGDPFAPPVWRNLSDILADELIWQNRPLYDRLDAAYPFLGLVTTHSVSVRALTANRPDNPDEEQQNRRPSTLIVERILTGDRGALETVRFGFHQRITAQMGDSDLRSASPITDGSRHMTLADLRVAHGLPASDKETDTQSGGEKEVKRRASRE